MSGAAKSGSPGRRRVRAASGRTDRPFGQRGYVLVTVMVTAFLVAAIAYLLSQASTASARSASAAHERAEAHYAAEAGLRHGLWLARQANCSDYSSLVDEPFGTANYTVTPTPAGGSPVALESMATLPSGTVVTLRSASTPIIPASSSTDLVIQPGAAGLDTYLRDGANDSNNFGASPILKLNNQSAEEATLLAFDLSAIPANAVILSATLELWLEGGLQLNDGRIDAHRVTQAWVEGALDGQAPVPGTGATYNSYDGQRNWASPGGDYVSPPIDTASIPALAPGWYGWDLTQPVRDWVDGVHPNDGVLLRASGGIVDKIWFTSGDGASATQPKLTVTYGCECGQVCLAASPPRDLLLVVGDAANLTPQEVARQTLVEGWGYTVTIIDDNASQAEFDAAAAASDVAYVPEDILTGAFGTKLREAAIGVVIEEQKIRDEFGLASGESTFDESSIDVTDNSHYITELFSPGLIAIAASTQPLGGAAGTLAPGLKTLAIRPSSSPVMLSAIEAGEALYDSGTSAGRRVMLPWGGNDFDINALNDDGRTLLKRSLEWASGSGNPAPPAPTPLAHWKFDEGSGTLAADAVGNHDGTINGSTWVTGRIDGGLSLDGSSDWVEVPDDPALSLTEAFTFTAWINKSGMSDWDSILHKGSWGSDNYFFGTDGDELHLSLGGADEWSTAGVDLATGTWYHVAVTFDDSADEVFFYVDGVERLAVTTTATPTTNANTLIVGDGNTFNDTSWQGILDDVRIYDTALTASQIAALAASAPETGPIAHWKLDETAGTTAVDSVGGNDGTLSGNGVWTSAAVGGGLSVDYNDGQDYVLVPNSAGLESVQENDYTLAAWFRPDSTPPGSGADNDANYGILIKVGWHTGLHFTADGRFSAWHHLDGDINVASTSSATYAPGSFYHVASVVDRAAGLVTLYVNGQPADTTSFTPGATAREYGTESWKIGVANPWGSTWGWPAHGVIDDVRIYDRVVTASELAALYAAGGGSGTGGTGSESCDGNYLDNFDTAAFSGNNGSLSWGSDWAEVGESDGPGTGDVRVREDTAVGRAPYSLQIQDNNNGGEGVERLVNLAGAGSASLRLRYRREGLDNSSDYVAVYASSNGLSGPWTELPAPRIEGSGTDSAYVEFTRDLGAFRVANAAIRLLGSPNLGGSDRVYFDEIEITCSP